jgi:hypothetical protein
MIVVVESAAVTGFEVEGASPSEFVDRVRSALSGWGLQGHTELELAGGDLVFRVRWMGTTELRYRISESADGFTARLHSESVAPFHSPFRHTFEERFDEVLQRVGARVTAT